tara:strand:+ start:61 stop:228 length:168 start_codon:yes stop_codon:yes gene_type:complete
MRITRRQLRQIIENELWPAAVVTPRIRRQNDRKGWSSGIYEESEIDGGEEEPEDR